MHCTKIKKSSLKKLERIHWILFPSGLITGDADRLTRLVHVERHRNSITDLMSSYESPSPPHYHKFVSRSERMTVYWQSYEQTSGLVLFGDGGGSGLVYCLWDDQWDSSRFYTYKCMGFLPLPGWGCKVVTPFGPTTSQWLYIFIYHTIARHIWIYKMGIYSPECLRRKKKTLSWGCIYWNGLSLIMSHRAAEWGSLWIYWRTSPSEADEHIVFIYTD